MYAKGTVSYQPLPLPDRVQLPDARSLAAVQAFRDYMKKRHSVRDFAPRPVPREVITAAIATAGTAPSGGP
jgi:iodotyrosine deiodinase